MNFFHDTARNLLVYQPPSQFHAHQILERIPEARGINGEYVAVPATLQNSQTLRWMQWPVAPVITDAGYNWPIKRGYTPLAHQKIMANFMVLHPRCFNLSDMGCVGGETLIDTIDGKIRIDVLAESGRPIVVRTLTDEGPRFVEVPAPFHKGHDNLYRVKFKSGRSIVVTKRHVFLTSRGWVSCENLAISEQLPVFDVYPQQSNWEPCHVRSLQDARHLSKIISSCRGYSDILFCDEPPLSAAKIDLSLIPSLDDALIHSRFEWRTDAKGNKYICMDPFSGDPQSKRHCGVRIDRGEMGSFLSEYATKQNDNQFHICAQYHLFPNQLREGYTGQELRLCIPLSGASASPFDTVTHITYERTDVYYDMNVPEHENYVAHGLCNHNTMKTTAALWAADWLMRRHPPKTCRALIVAPLSILQRVWGDAVFENFLGNRTFDILYGDADKRERILQESTADFLIINFDGVKIGAHFKKHRDPSGPKQKQRMELDGLCKALADRKDIQIAIVDEASGYRDAQTDRHLVAREVIGKRPYLWLMTGTPTPQAPTDAYGMAKLVNNAWGKSFGTFQQDTMYKQGPFRWVPRRDGYDKARQLLTPSIRFDIKDVWDGPAASTQQREVLLTDGQKKLMKELKDRLQVTVRTGPITPQNEAAVRTKFLQISLGAIYDSEHEVHAVDAEPRLKEAETVLEQTDRKVVIFVPLTSVLNLVYKRLSKRWTGVILNGPVTPKQRAENIKRFEVDDEVKFVVADPGTTAHGINEFALVADTVLWYGIVEKNELFLQGNKRVNRPGQRYPMTFVQLVSNPLEREIYRRLETNTSLQGALLDVIAKGEM